MRSTLVAMCVALALGAGLSANAHQEKSSVSEIVVILDRSGSMESIQTDMEGGLNSFVAKQQALDVADIKFTLAQFDTEYELIHDGIPLADVPHIVLEPRGNTALLDAVGKTLSTVREREPDGRVIVIIVTDGEENSSTEWNLVGVKVLIEKCQCDDWEIIYLGANVDAFAAAGGMGVVGSTTVTFTSTSDSVELLWDITNDSVSQAVLTGADVSFTDEQRDAINPIEDEPDEDTKP